MARTLSPDELCSEAGASLERVKWLTRIGILQPRTRGVYTSGDAFRVKMIESLLQAGFTQEQVEAAVEAAGLDLSHVDRYILVEPGERSRRTFAEFAAEAGPHADRVLTAAYQLLGIAPPAPESHLRLHRLGERGSPPSVMIKDADSPVVGSAVKRLTAYLEAISGKAPESSPQRISIMIGNFSIAQEYDVKLPDGQVLSGQYVRILVSKTGQGLEAAEMKRVFEPGLTGKDLPRGTDLRLASVHGVVTQSGGIVHVSSERGAGTTFQVYLPVASVAPTRTRT